VSNVRARHKGDGIVEVRANFVVHRSRDSILQTFPGHYEYELETGGSAGFRIRVKKAIVDLEELRPHGRVAILL
jgi:p-cumate 2,3-dioxygenase beta subunit